MKEKNKIAEAMMAIEARHTRLAGLFSAAVVNSRAFKKEQLAEVEGLLSRYKKGLTKDEQFYRKMLLEEKRQMERRLYPNAYFRLLRNLVRLGLAIVELTVVKKKVLARKVQESEHVKEKAIWKPNEKISVGDMPVKKVTAERLATSLTKENVTQQNKLPEIEDTKITPSGGRTMRMRP